MNEPLNEILEKAKAARLTNDALLSAFENYIQILLRMEVDYQYIKVDEHRKGLKLSSAKMALYEARLSRLTDEENFNHFCRYIHMQMEGLLNFYFHNYCGSLEKFAEEYENMFKPKLNQAMEFDYDKFLEEVEIDRKRIDSTDVSQKELVQNEIETKWKEIKEKFIENKMKLKVYLKPEDEIQIRTSDNFDFLKRALKNIDTSYYTSIERVPFQNKWDLFDFKFNLDLKFKITIFGLTDFRNKVLSHSGGSQEVALNKNAQSLVARKNYIAIKEALIELNDTVKSTLNEESRDS